MLWCNFQNAVQIIDCADIILHIVGAKHMLKMRIMYFKDLRNCTSQQRIRAFRSHVQGIVATLNSFKIKPLSNVVTSFSDLYFNQLCLLLITQRFGSFVLKTVRIINIQYMITCGLNGLFRNNSLTHDSVIRRGKP